MQVREIQKTEINQVACLEQQIFSDAWSNQSIMESLEQDHTILLGAFEEEKLAGYLIVYYVIDEAEIARVAVDPSYRRQGVAGSLLNELKKYSESLGIIKWLLDVRESNVPAISFYKKWGFTEDGIRRRFYSNPVEDAVLMSLSTGKGMEGLTAVPTGNGQTFRL